MRNHPKTKANESQQASTLMIFVELEALKDTRHRNWKANENVKEHLQSACLKCFSSSKTPFNQDSTLIVLSDCLTSNPSFFPEINQEKSQHKALNSVGLPSFLGESISLGQTKRGPSSGARASAP